MTNLVPRVSDAAMSYADANLLPRVPKQVQRAVDNPRSAAAWSGPPGRKLTSTSRTPA